VQDEYFKKAKKEGYRARSVYKLLEIQERFNIIKPEFSVIDI
jgi:23S rRNA (uridine2552-2'-O)-methyltransferase